MKTVMLVAALMGSAVRAEVVTVEVKGEKKSAPLTLKTAAQVEGAMVVNLPPEPEVGLVISPDLKTLTWGTDAQRDRAVRVLLAELKDAGEARRRAEQERDAARKERDEQKARADAAEKALAELKASQSPKG